MFARRWLTADLAITIVLLALFIWVILQARMLPFRASLFPVFTASVAVALILLKLVLDLRPSASPRSPRQTDPPIEQVGLRDEDEVTEIELEDVFQTAPRPVWVGALAWMAGFFAMLWALGMLITVPVFTLLYLILVSRDSLLLACAYAAVSWVFVYILFDQTLHIALPTGALLGSIGR